MWNSTVPVMQVSRLAQKLPVHFEVCPSISCRKSGVTTLVPRSKRRAVCVAGEIHTEASIESVRM